MLGGRATRVLDCTYELADVRHGAEGGDFGLVMMIFGQFNVFARDEARGILARALAVLAPGGQ